MTLARVVVVGAGVSGLAAAVELVKAGADVLVLESSDVPGGALRSHRAEGFLFEDGPTSVFDSDGSARAFFADVGIEGEIVASRPEARERYLWHEGRLQAVPAKPAELLKSSLLSVFERIRVLKEMLIAPANNGVEETVSEFAARRFGSGVATKFAAAVVSGIYAGDPDRLSFDACFPELRAIEREHGSLLKGLAARAEERRAAGGPARSGGMITFQSGLGRVGEACAAKLGSRLRTRTRVVAVESGEAGVAVSIESGGARETLDAGAVILATGARAAASIPGALPAPVAAVLGAIEHASIAVVQAGFLEESLPGLPSGFGFLVPRGAGLESLGWIFTSQVFDGRAPKGSVALTGIFGGMLAPAPLLLDDEALAALALREIGQALELKAPPRPAYLRVVRWREVLPQYVLGHAGRIRGAREELASRRPRIVLAGNYLDGVAIPKCIASGLAAAAQVLRSQGAVVEGASG